MTYKEAITFRQTEEFLRIQSEIALKDKEMTALFKELNSKCPLEKDCYWTLNLCGDVFPTHWYKDEENED